MSEPRPQRVRVTGPPRRTRPRASATDPDDDTALGGVYLASLLREQRRLAARVVAVLLVLVASLPAVFHLAPGLADVEVGGVSLPWALLGVAVYPLLVGLGWSYLRRAERHERDYTDLVRERRG
ncbi:hypothetical protein GCM10009737_14050 [Nocardioides lentus]|uniref:DUF485 domain-containing protein n=1 Tax=Nocardioides lentus TaxID=338077 RepID=A0ABN2P756_9ACTN